RLTVNPRGKRGDRGTRNAPSNMQPPGMTHPRRVEAKLLAGAVLLTTLAGLLLGWSQGPDLPPEAIVTSAALAVVALVAHVIVRYVAPDADPVILPIAVLLNGVGLVFVRRVDLAAGTDLAITQTVWTAVTV